MSLHGRYCSDIVVLTKWELQRSTYQPNEAVGEERRRDDVFKTTFCLTHPPKQSVFVLNGVVHNSEKKRKGGGKKGKKIP